MLAFKRVAGCLRLGPHHAVWATEERTWRGRSRYHWRTIALPEGLLRPSRVEPNITDPATLATLLRQLVGSEGDRARPIVLIIPDLCVRASVMEVTAWPTRPSEREALVRWRLEKESAFPIAGARVVSRVLNQKAILTVAIRETVLRQYEELCEATGLSPVEVDTAAGRLCSALADSAPADGPVAWLSLLDDGFTFFICREGNPSFIRTKIQAPSGWDGVLHDLAASLAFYTETRPQSPPKQLMLICEEPVSTQNQRLTEELGLNVVPITGAHLRPSLPDSGSRQLSVDALTAVAGLHQVGAHTNLSSIGPTYVNAVRVGLVLLALLLTGLIVWDLQQTATVNAQTVAAEKALAHIREQDKQMTAQAAAEHADLSEAAMQRLPKEVAFANQILTRRAFSWTRFLADLEDAVPPRLSIRSLQLDSKSSLITINGAALTLKDLTRFIIGLEDHRTFQNAVLSHHRTLENGSVEFVLTVQYRTASGGG